jgi:hypothetical protein
LGDHCVVCGSLTGARSLDYHEGAAGMRARDPSRPVRGVLPQPEERDVLVEELHHPQTAGLDVSTTC